jgi:hypothetical protein
VLRACITSFRTQPEDLDVLLDELDGAIERARMVRCAPEAWNARSGEATSWR